MSQCRWSVASALRVASRWAADPVHDRWADAVSRGPTANCDEVAPFRLGAVMFYHCRCGRYAGHRLPARSTIAATIGDHHAPRHHTSTYGKSDRRGKITGLIEVRPIVKRKAAARPLATKSKSDPSGDFAEAGGRQLQPIGRVRLKRQRNATLPPGRATGDHHRAGYARVWLTTLCATRVAPLWPPRLSLNTRRARPGRRAVLRTGIIELFGPQLHARSTVSAEYPLNRRRRKGLP